MLRDENRRVDHARAGLAVVFVLGVSGLGLLAAAESLGGPGWPPVIFLGLGLAAVFLYLPVYRAQRQLQQTLTETETSRGTIESVLVVALEFLRTGDLVRCGERAGELPERLRDAFRAAAAALDDLAQQIQNSSIEVASAANSVNEIASELASGSSEQAASVVEITAAMEELARTASQIADNATLQADLAARAEESGNSGAVAVEEAVDGVEEVRKRITGIANRADTLGTRSKEIYRVLDLITEISQETHILSLNAAIEAAAAGEHGRRFSVVAEEVRRLAQRASESVDSVRNLLDEFTSSIRATVVATEEGTKEAARVLERARAAAAAIDELKGASGDTARVAKEISLATQQQNAASDEVVLTLKEVSQVVQRMADGLKQFSATSDRLNHLALTIQLLAQSFHLDSPRSLKHRALDWAQKITERLDSWESVESLLQRLSEEIPYVELVYVCDAGGRQIAVVAKEEILAGREIPASVRGGEGLSERPWFRNVLREKRPIITPVYDSLLTEETCFTVAVPLWKGETLAGVLGLDINVGSWTKI